MKLLFENWRSHTNTLKEQLLIEGRIDDVKKKYPRIPKIIDYLVGRDPSGNQKYLAWAAKQTEVARSARAQYVPTGSGLDVAQLESSWVPELAASIEKFHKWNQRMPKFGFSKDINSYKDYESLRNAVYKVEEEATQATKRAEEKKAAFSEAEVIDETESYFVVRPMSAQASCFFGRSTQWCISAERSHNYFESYTNEGKMFYFVFMKQIDPSSKYKKLAFVLDNDFDLESVFDAEDDELTHVEITEAFIQNLLNQGANEGAWMTYLWAEGDRYADDPTERDKEAYVEALKRLGIDWDPVPGNEQSERDEFVWRNEEIREQVQEVEQQIMEQIRDHAYQNPAGPTEADYQKIQDAFEQSAEHSHVYFDEYEDNKYYYSGGMSFDFDDLEWIDEYETDNEEIIEEVVREAADDAYVYIDEIEVYNNEARLDFRPDYDESDIDGFEKFADRVLEYDKQWQEVYDASIEEFKKRRLIPAPDMEKEREYWPDPEEKAKQMELPLETQAEKDAEDVRNMPIRESKNKTKLIIEIKKIK